MPTFHVTKYPIVDPSPSTGKTVGNFNFRDCSNIVGFTGLGFTCGFFGARRQTRLHNAKFLGCIGLLAGLCYANQNSMQRFMGLEPNDYEVQKYGVYSLADLETHNIKQMNPNHELIGKTTK